MFLNLKKKISTISLLIIILTQQNLASYYVSICSMFQNEAPYLKEWIEYHKLIGIQHFYLYNNLSTDNFLEVLQPYIDAGDIDLINWPHTDPINWLIVQYNAYRDVLKQFGTDSQWIAFLDLDEFLLPVEVDNIVDFLVDYEAYAGLGVNWQYYGTSFVDKIPNNKLLLETLVYKAPDDFNINLHIKSIVQPKYTIDIADPHSFNYKNGYFCVTPNKEAFSGPFSPKICIDKIRINHYWTRDENYFNNVKIKRRMRYGDSDIIISEWRRLNKEIFNTIKDEKILRFTHSLRKNLGFE